jgi:hypothetical protein
MRFMFAVGTWLALVAAVQFVCALLVLAHFPGSAAVFIITGFLALAIGSILHRWKEIEIEEETDHAE